MMSSRASVNIVLKDDLTAKESGPTRNSLAMSSSRTALSTKYETLEMALAMKNRITKRPANGMRQYGARCKEAVSCLTTKSAKARQMIP